LHSQLSLLEVEDLLTMQFVDTPQHLYYVRVHFISDMINLFVLLNATKTEVGEINRAAI